MMALLFRGLWAAALVALVSGGVAFANAGEGTVDKGTVDDQWVNESRVDDQWVVEQMDDKTVFASVNGLVMHGDRLRVRLVKGHCDTGNLITSVYTLAGHPEITALENRLVRAKFMGQDIVVKVLFTFPFLAGHRSTVDLGWVPVAALKDILAAQNPITMAYLDSNEINITAYFDIAENRWMNGGLAAALDRAVAQCRALEG